MSENTGPRGEEEKAMIEAAAAAAAGAAAEQSFAQFVQSPGAVQEGLGAAVVPDETAVSTGAMNWIRDFARQRRVAIGATLATVGLTSAVGWGAAYANGNEAASVTPGLLDPTSTAPTDPSTTDTPTVELPIAKADSMSFIPWWKYNVTKELLSNDVVNDGGELAGDTLEITGVTPITQEGVESEVSYDPETHQVYLTPQGTEEGQTLDFSYTEERSSDNASATGNASFLVDKTTPIRTKHLANGQVEWINNNPAKVFIKDFINGGRRGIKSFWVKAHSVSKPKWPPKAPNEWFSSLTKHKIPFTAHWLRPRHKSHHPH